ncbi:Helicase, C-terminal [uncultured Caudovirales phage]|uniref:Helicase, C-terminal n=1 Tax=uncultured Caudovirales phage TaxID=2100421 RepID=A0A6J5NGE8_9CAUD|nr:Helicase, C-terminal [uncultured Caudovirales phage]CAB5224310.1 Helicase, C-terminal [uncultured Caudovirales phage]
MIHKPFQREDLAAAACVDSLILSWEQGLGKTIASVSWPFLKRASRTLLVVPGGLHEQYQKDVRNLYKIHVPILRTEADLIAHRINTPITAAPENRLGKYFLISYENLTKNNADEKASTSAHIVKSRALDLSLLHRDAAIAALENQPLDHTPYFAGIGRTDRDITCVWAPTMARILSHYESHGWGFDCVVLDEGVRLQSDSDVSLQTRMLNPRYRMILTGTPIKNRLGSIFNLAWWAAGGSPTPTAKFPYALTDRGKFIKSHLEIDRYLTREEDRAIATQTRREEIRIEKESARVCNVHRLWRTLSPLLIRRRKVDCGESIVMKTIQPITVPLGTAQSAVYHHHLNHRPARNKDGALVKHITSLGMQLTNLRLAACCPDAPSLGEVISAGGNPHQRCSWSPWTPKLHATLTKIAELLACGESVVIGSPFTHFTQTLQQLLTEAHVKSIALDGNVSPSARGSAIEAFKAGHYSVAVCGLYSMSEGYSLDSCAHLIMPGKAFAYDTNNQFEARVWRITSKRPVTIYPVVTQTTIDERMEELYGEKSDTADLTLDGALFEDIVEEFDAEKMYYDALQLFKGTQSTIDETQLEATWPALKVSLKYGQSIFDEFHPPILGDEITPSDISTAMQSFDHEVTAAQAASRLLTRLRNLRDQG